MRIYYSLIRYTHLNSVSRLAFLLGTNKLLFFDDSLFKATATGLPSPLSLGVPVLTVVMFPEK